MQVLTERKRDSAVLFGFFALVGAAVAIRVAFGPMGTTGKAIVIAIGALVAAGCVYGLVATRRRAPGRIEVTADAISQVAGNGAVLRVARQPVTIRRRIRASAQSGSATWWIEPADGQIERVHADGTSAPSPGSLLLHGYRPDEVAAACRAEGWDVTA